MGTIRPRLLGAKASLVFEPTEKRHNAIEFDVPLRDTDVFEVVIPAGYEIDCLRRKPTKSGDSVKSSRAMNAMPRCSGERSR